MANGATRYSLQSYNGLEIDDPRHSDQSGYIRRAISQKNMYAQMKIMLTFFIISKRFFSWEVCVLKFFLVKSIDYIAYNVRFDLHIYYL